MHRCHQAREHQLDGGFRLLAKPHHLWGDRPHEPQPLQLRYQCECRHLGGLTVKFTAGEALLEERRKQLVVELGVALEEPAHVRI
jgi:hypothetical protein